jgi:formate hydrogenlyase subunit 4
MEVERILLVLAALLFAPIVGGALTGADRKLTARMQKRIGPPLMQPFYDAVKLFSKQRLIVNGFQSVSVSVYLASMALSLVLLVLGMDLLVLLFVLALGSVALILGGFSVKSPYSQMGSQREVLQLLAYEPLLVLMVVAIYLKTGSFSASSVMSLRQPLIYSLPLFVITMLLVMAIKLHKSPMDISGSHHAHQELVRGIYTEFSGPQMGLIEIAHWYELVFLLGFIALFWHTNLLCGALLALGCYFAVIVIDNITARMTWRWMLRVTWLFGIGASLLNLFLLYGIAGR